jgi:hypothetical protein
MCWFQKALRGVIEMDKLKDFFDLKIRISCMIIALEWIVFDIFNQQYAIASERFMDLIERIERVLKLLPEKEIINQLTENLTAVVECMQKQDYLLMADYLNIGIKKLMMNYLEEKHIEYPDIFLEKESWENYRQHIIFDHTQMKQFRELPTLNEFNQRGYEIENTSIGAVTVARTVRGNRIYLHSNISPYESAWSLVNEWAKSNAERYIILGAGLCYHITQLWNIDKSKKIEVYESDIHYLQIVSACTDRGFIFSVPNISIIYDPGYRKFLSAASKANEKHEKVCFYYPSIQVIEDSYLREKLLNLYTELDNMERWKPIMQKNFNFNTKHIQCRVDELQDSWKDRNVYLIAGGPSLEKNIKGLKKVCPSDIILCVGRSFHRLISEGIKPNYVIITDPKPAVLAQISGLEKSKIPLLLLSTAYYQLAKNYQGEKYLLFQKSYQEAEALAKTKNLMLFKTGSSVITTALDMCIQFKCKRVIFLGLDLAYTDNKIHHSGEVINLNHDAAICVEDIYGRKVTTNKTFYAYHHWIEERIREEINSSIEFIDATEGGAKIKGTKITSLEEIVKDIKDKDSRKNAI